MKYCNSKYSDMLISHCCLEQGPNIIVIPTLFPFYMGQWMKILQYLPIVCPFSFLVVDSNDAFKLTKSHKLDIMICKLTLFSLVQFIVFSSYHPMVTKHLDVSVHFKFHVSIQVLNSPPISLLLHPMQFSIKSNIPCCAHLN